MEDPVLDAQGNVQYRLVENKEQLRTPITEEKKKLLMAIQKWKNKVDSNPSTKETVWQTLQRSKKNRERAQQALNERAQTVTMARNRLKKAIEKERRTNSLTSKVDSDFKRSMALAVYTTPQTATMMASTLVTLLASIRSGTASNNNTQEQLSPMGLAICDPNLAVIRTLP